MFAIRLKELREQAGFSQAVLARKLGVRQSTVGMWENGSNKPQNSKLEMLATMFGVSTDYLLGRSDDPQRKTEQEHEDGTQMTDAEYALSMRIRKLSEKGKNDVMNFIAFTESLEQDHQN